MTTPFDSSGPITPHPTPPNTLSSPTGPPAAAPQLSAVPYVDDYTSHSLTTLHSHSPSADAEVDTTPFTSSLSSRQLKRLSRSHPTPHCGIPASPLPLAQPTVYEVISSDDSDVDCDGDTPLAYADSPLVPDTELSAPPSPPPADSDMNTPPPAPPSTTVVNAYTTLMGQAGKKRSNTAVDSSSSPLPHPSSAPPTCHPSSSSSPPSLPPSSTGPSSSPSPAPTSSSPSSSTSSAPYIATKRSKGDALLPPAPSRTREDFMLRPTPPSSDSSSSSSLPEAAPAAQKRGKGAGRPLHSGGTTKSVLQQQLNESIQLNSHLQAQIRELSAQVARLTSSPSPPQPSATSVPLIHPTPPPSSTSLIGSSPSPAATSIPSPPPQPLHGASPAAISAPPSASPAPVAPPPVPAQAPPPPQVISNPSPPSIPVPAMAAATHPAPAPPRQAPPPPPTGPRRHPTLPPDQRARPSQAFVQTTMGLPLTSKKDLTLSVAFPPNTRSRFTMNRPPHHSNNDSKLVHSISSMLVKGLGIPAPRLLKATSQHDQPANLHAALVRTWAAPPPAGASPSSAHLQSLPPQRRVYLDAITAADQGDCGTTDKLGSALLQTPTDVPDSACHTHWYELLNPHTDTLASSTSPTGTRHVLRLAFNSELVALAVRVHLERYMALLLPQGDSHTPSALATMDPWKRSWVHSATRDNIIHCTVRVDVYAIRWETTLVSGWMRGPDHPPHPSEVLDFDQLYGDDNRLLIFLSRYAPHCFPHRKFTFLADGTGCIQFVHEAQHRNELYRLVGLTSPSHGINRPLRLDFRQLRKPVVQCCSACGSPGHSASSCPRRPDSSPNNSPAPDEGKMEAEVAPLPLGTVVCRHCYSPSHRETCNTPPELQRCKICNETGHTSFHCAQYRTSWVPLSPPSSSLAPNPRPLAIIAQQQGLPPPTTWSAVAAGGASLPPPSIHHPPPPSLADVHAFPSLPGAQPASATASPSTSLSTSSPRSAPASSSHFPPSPPSAELAALRAELAAMKADVGQSISVVKDIVREQVNQTLRTSFFAFQHLLDNKTSDLTKQLSQVLTLFQQHILRTSSPAASLPPASDHTPEWAAHQPPPEILAFMQRTEQPSPGTPTVASASTPQASPSPACHNNHGNSTNSANSGTGSVNFTIVTPMGGSAQTPQVNPNSSIPAAHPPHYSATTSSPPLQHQ